MKVGHRDYYPDVADLRKRIGEVMGAPATIKRFAELVGCSKNSVTRWEKGECPPALMFRPRLVELEHGLRDVKPVMKALEEKRRAPLLASKIRMALKEKLISFCFVAGGREIEVLVPIKALLDACCGSDPA